MKAPIWYRFKSSPKHLRWWAHQNTYVGEQPITFCIVNTRFDIGLKAPIWYRFKSSDSVTDLITRHPSQCETEIRSTGPQSHKATKKPKSKLFARRYKQPHKADKIQRPQSIYRQERNLYVASCPLVSDHGVQFFNP